MSRHLALKHAACEKCIEALAAPKRSLFGWGKMEKLDTSNFLPIQEIVSRRTEWLEVMAAQAERKRRRDKEEGGKRNCE